ncbi:MAG: CoA transferase [Actinobacteria bacterium]|nr:CoA transferase [Actinomycetota bacterium]
MIANTGPLAGTRILDLTHVLNGPFCTMLLAHMGADVLKVEHGAGDRFRHAWMPTDAGRDGYESLVVNANKRCITLNLKSEAGKEIFGKLVAKSDVVVENFSPGVMDRLGFGYQHLREIRPDVIYARSSGYGSSGPYVDVPAFAMLIQAISGWTDSGWTTPAARGSKPLGIGDEGAGVSMALGILAALYARERTGEGDYVDVAMQEAQLGFMVSSLHTLFEHQPVASAPVECADGYVAFHLPDLSPERWSALCESMGHPEIVDDPRFDSIDNRRTNFEQLMAEAQKWVRTMTRAELWRVFRDLNLPGAPVRTVGEAVEDENLRSRGAMLEVEHPDAGTVKMLRPWIRFAAYDTTIRHAGPAVGEHNAEVYGELLGLSSEELEELAGRGVI